MKKTAPDANASTQEAKRARLQTALRANLKRRKAPTQKQKATDSSEQAPQ